MDLNLDTLKREILEYLDSSGLAVFHGSPGRVWTASPWCCGIPNAIPITRCFWMSPSRAETRVIIFASREFQAADIEELLAQLDELDLTREEKREYENASARTARA